jgi:hypothetical protein
VITRQHLQRLNLDTPTATTTPTVTAPTPSTMAVARYPSVSCSVGAASRLAWMSVLF